MRHGWISLAAVVAFGCGGDDAPDEGVVTVTVYSGNAGVPLENGDVVAVNPDGSYATTRTAADGTASLTIQAGASVVALEPRAGESYRVEAVLDVEPGADLVIGDDSPEELGEWIGAMTITVPAMPGAETYAAISYCMVGSSVGAATSVRIDRYANCDPSIGPLYLFAQGPNFEEIGYATIDDFTFVADGTTSIDAWQPMTELSVAVPTMPAEVEQMIVEAHAGIGVSPGLYGGGGQASNQAFTWTGPWAPIGDFLELTLHTRIEETTTQWTRRRVAASTTSYAFEDEGVLPWITAMSVSTAAGAVTVTLDGDAPHDRIVLSFDAQAAAGAPVPHHDWRVVAPPAHDGDNVITLPILPAPFDVVNLREGMVIAEVDLLVSLFDFDGIDGYAAARALSSAPFAGDYRESRHDPAEPPE